MVRTKLENAQFVWDFIQIENVFNKIKDLGAAMSAHRYEEEVALWRNQQMDGFENGDEPEKKECQLKDTITVVREQNARVIPKRPPRNCAMIIVIQMTASFCHASVPIF